MSLRFAPLFLSILLVSGCESGPADSTRDVSGWEWPLETVVEATSLVAPTATIDFGTQDAWPHLGEGWSVDERLEPEGATVVWAVGDRSTVEFDAFSDRDLEVELKVKPFLWRDGPEQMIVPRLNGHPLPSLRFERELRSYSLDLPGELLELGRNRLVLESSHAVAPFDLDPSLGDRRRLAAAWDELVFGPAIEASAAPDLDEPIQLRAGHRLRLYLRSPPGSRLSVDSIELDGVALHVRARTEITPNASPDLVTGRSTVIDLPEGLVEVSFIAFDRRFLGRGPAVARLDGISLRSSTAPPSSNSDRAPAESPRSTLQTRPNVIIYLVDTLRADHLGSQGSTTSRTPRIDAFAASALTYTRASAQSSWTRSAVASLLTGLNPHRHGVIGREHELATERQTLAELLSEAGYQSAAFITNGNVGSHFGFAQGFGTFVELRRTSEDRLHASSDELNRRVFEHLDRRTDPDRPVFLYVHAMEPHAPYRPPGVDRAALRQLFPAAELDAEEIGRLSALVENSKERSATLDQIGSVPWLQALNAGAIEPDARMIEALIELYDSEIETVDRSFGAFVDGLRARKLFDDSVLVFLSDHGEEFAEHGAFSHGRTLFNEQLHIPFMVKPPGFAGDGRLVTSPARQVDVLPTVLRAAGIPSPRELDGRDLLGFDETGASSFALLNLDERTSISLTQGRRKITCLDSGLFRCALFDLEDDPMEHHDVCELDPVHCGLLSATIGTILAQGTVAAPTALLDPEIEAQLEALGY